MDLLLILTYTAICIAVFKIFKIPLNKWSVPTAVLGGIALIGALILLMNYNHPHSRSAVRAFVSVPIVPNVRGLVVEVPVQPNTHLKKGDVLFKINPEPFQLVVNQKLGALNVAKSQVPQLEASVELAKSQLEKAKSERDRTKMAFERAKAAGAAMAATVLESKQQFYVSAEASVRAAQSQLNRAMFELATLKEEKLVQLEADVKRAQFDLESTVVKAPADGYVTQVLVRKGVMAVPIPLRPTMVFVPDADHFVVASFRQNAIQRLKAGYEAELIFPSIPGRIFKGKIVKTLPAMGEGELQSSGNLIKSSAFMGAKAGLVPVVVELEDDMSPYILPDGVFAEVAVYSDHFHHVAIMRKVLLRMKSWQNYVYLDH